MVTTNAAAHIAKIAIFEGVAYELHHSARIRVYDVDAEEVVSWTFYPSMAKAEAAYAAVVADAKATA